VGTKTEKLEVSAQAEVAPEVHMPEMPFSDAEHRRIAMTTAQALAKQPKVKIRLRALSKDKPGDETVQVNGYTYLIMRGVDVEVPQTVADILIESGLY
jgi:hypothetical protein